MLPVVSRSFARTGSRASMAAVRCMPLPVVQRPVPIPHGHPSPFPFHNAANLQYAAAVGAAATAPATGATNEKFAQFVQNLQETTTVSVSNKEFTAASVVEQKTTVITPTGVASSTVIVESSTVPMTPDDSISSSSTPEAPKVPVYLQEPRVHHHLKTLPGDIDMVIYHGGCYDGMGAAWAAWKLLGDKATYHAMQHNRQLPKIAGRNVALLDIAFTKNVMNHILSHAKSLVVLDHHISAELDVKFVPDEHKVFDMERSGATLAWEYFHPGKPIPRFLLHIQDRDLWNWEMQDSEAFNAKLMISPLSFENFDSIFQGGDAMISEMINAGKHIVDFANHAYKLITNRAVKRIFATSGHLVLSVNSSVFKSEVGNILSEREGVDFAAVWHFDHVKKSFWVSLRSCDKNPNAVDVSQIAKQFGGGGHHHAAAFDFKGHSIEELFEELPRAPRPGSKQAAESVDIPLQGIPYQPPQSPSAQQAPQQPSHGRSHQHGSPKRFNNQYDQPQQSHYGFQQQSYQQQQSHQPHQQFLQPQQSHYQHHQGQQPHHYQYQPHGQVFQPPNVHNNPPFGGPKQRTGGAAWQHSPQHVHSHPNSQTNPSLGTKRPSYSANTMAALHAAVKPQEESAAAASEKVEK